MSSDDFENSGAFRPKKSPRPPTKRIYPSESGRAPKAPPDPTGVSVKAADLVSRKEYSAKGLTEKLVRFGYAVDVAEEAVTRLVDCGAVSDGRFAEMIVHAAERRGQGPLWVSWQSRMKGVKDDPGPDQNESESVRRGVTDVDWFDVCLTELKKSAQDLSDQKKTQKVVARMIRRGFPPGIVYRAIKELKLNITGCSDFTED